MRKLGGMTMLALAMALTACGSPAPRDRCDSPAPCAAGHYCAPGGVCWPDAVPPVIDSATVGCLAPCLRDSTVTVAVTAHDDVGLAAVTARLDLAPATVVPLTLQGATWRGDLPLGAWPFPDFERAVEVTVEARDAAGNAATAARTIAQVTRLRWAVDFAPGDLPVPVPGAVAVDQQGTAVFGGSNGKVHFIGPDGTVIRDRVQVGTGSLTAPVVVGSDGVWVPSEDGKVYRVPVDPLAAVEMACNTRAPVKGLALSTTGEPVAASASGANFAVQGCINSPTYTGDVLYQPIAHGSTFYGAEGNRLHDLTLNTFGLFVEGWIPPASLGSPIAASMALRANGDILALTAPTAGGNTLFAVSPAGVVAPLAATGLPADGPVVKANGDVVVPEAGKTLSCWTSAGALRWRSAALPGVPLTPLLLSGADTLVVADGRGALTALDDAGQARWTVQLAPSGTALHPLNLHAPPGATRSTGYIPAANGKLYAVILDGRLDAAAPWPKAFHDPRNTGNSATAQPPP
jgi:outer membrane protein assembly factor BamB